MQHPACEDQNQGDREVEHAQADDQAPLKVHAPLSEPLHSRLSQPHDEHRHQQCAKRQDRQDVVAAPRAGKAEEQEHQYEGLDQPSRRAVEVPSEPGDGDQSQHEQRRPRQQQHGQLVQVQVHGPLVVERLKIAEDVLLKDQRQPARLIIARSRQGGV